MDKTVFNLTLAVVLDEIEQLESVLQTYPDHPYHKAFAVSDWRQQLITYVINRIPNTYKVVEGTERIVDPKTVHCCLERRLQIEELLNQGMWQLIQQNLDGSCHLASKDINLRPQYN